MTTLAVEAMTVLDVVQIIVINMKNENEDTLKRTFRLQNSVGNAHSMKFEIELMCNGRRVYKKQNDRIINRIKSTI